MAGIICRGEFARESLRAETRPTIRRACSERRSARGAETPRCGRRSSTTAHHGAAPVARDVEVVEVSPFGSMSRGVAPALMQGRGDHVVADREVDDHEGDRGSARLTARRALATVRAPMLSAARHLVARLRSSSRIALCAAALAACAHAPGPRPPSRVEIETGSARAIDDTTVAYEIGTLFVPENRLNPESRTIGVGFARIKAARPAGLPPLFLLVGGPGVTMLETLTDADEASRQRVKLWREYAADTDLVVIEQRGYSLRGELLTLPRPAWPLDQAITVAADEAEAIALAGRAAAAFPGHDLAGYTVVQCAGDVDDLRRALGYDKIALMGGSFGSQWSLAVMRLHPGTVARALLSGVEPLDNGYDMPSHVLAALQRIALEADQDPGLAPWRPPGGLLDAAAAVQRRLEAEPLIVSVTDASTGAAQAVTLGPGDFQLALVSHAADAATWPAFVLSTYHGQYDAWAREVLAERQPGELKLIAPLIDTSLGVTPARERALRADPAVATVGPWNFAAYLAAAATWPSPDVGDELRTPVTDTTPVLFVQGDWDTSTPLENMQGLLPFFPNGRGMIVHRGPHTSPYRLLGDHDEALATIRRFFRGEPVDDLPATRSLPAIAFVLPPFPAPAG